MEIPFILYFSYFDGFPDPVLILQRKIALPSPQHEVTTEVSPQLVLPLRVEVGDSLVEKLVEVELVSHEELQAGSGTDERLVHGCE